MIFSPSEILLVVEATRFKSEVIEKVLHLLNLLNTLNSLPGNFVPYWPGGKDGTYSIAINF